MAEKAKTASLLAELGVEDLYGFLGVEPDCTDKEINRGYRKKALKYHPDKNQGDPNAAEMFQKLSKVLTVLTDPLARASYDRWQKAKHATRKRHDDLNVKRRKLKEELEQRESQGGSSNSSVVSETMSEREAAATMQREIERLREETQRRIQEQTELLRQQMTRGVSPADQEEDEDEMPTLKVTWKAKKSDASNGGYYHSLLEGLFSRYGPLHHVLVSSKRKGKALVSFHSSHHAQDAFEEETGMPACPLTVSWVCGQPKTTTHHPPEERGEVEREGREKEEGRGGGGVMEGGREEIDNGERCDQEVRGGSGDNLDYESIVLMKLRQAEERKRLCRDLAKDDS